MKKLVIILPIFVLLFGMFAGCTGTSTTETITSGTSTISSTSDDVDPILGSWINNTNLDPTKYFYITFSQSGNIIGTNKQFKADIGDWVKNQDNTYTVTYLVNGESSTVILIYDKNTDTLYEKGAPDEIAYRIAKTPKITQTNPSVTRTKVGVTSTSTLNNYQYCRDTYPGSSFDPSTNKCVYPTTVPSKTPTQILNSEIANAKFCFLNGVNEGISVGGPSSGPVPTFDSPLVPVAALPAYSLQMPVNPGKYKILLTTTTPESSVDLEIWYNGFVQKDKFGNPLYKFQKIKIGTSNKYADLNSLITIPDGSIAGKINIFQSIERLGRNDNCGTLIVTKI